MSGEPSSPNAVSTSRRPSATTTKILDSPTRAPRVSAPSRLPSISSSQPLDFDNVSPLPQSSMLPPTAGPSRTVGFSPSVSQSTFPVGAGSPISSHLSLNPAAVNRAHVPSPFTTPLEGTFQIQPGSPRPLPSSPRGNNFDQNHPSRSRRNSAAVVSISLSSRSRSRTPKGSTSVLPPANGSGSGTPSKSATPRVDSMTHLNMGDSWAPGVDDIDDLHPEGGLLLQDGDDEVYLDDDDHGISSGLNSDEGYLSKRSWTAETDVHHHYDVEDDVGSGESSSHGAAVLTPGMIFGEGLEFQGEIIEPAVGRVGDGSDGDVNMPLRRGGSEAGVVRSAARGPTGKPSEKKTYEVVRQLGSGSYAVVYLVRERGGRKREYALKCLSKQDLEEEQLETQLFEATIHLSLPIHTNIVTLHQTLQTKRWLFLMLELCPGEDLFYWLEKSRDASPPPINAQLPDERAGLLSSSKLSSSSIPFSSSQLFSNFSTIPSSFSNSPSQARSPGFGASPASLLFAHHNGGSGAHGSHGFGGSHAHTPPTPSLLSSFSANTLLTQRRLKLIASMFSQMCEAVAVCHDAGVSHRDIKPENFICCDSVELESVAEGEDVNGSSSIAINGVKEENDLGVGKPDFGPQARQKVIVKLTDFGLATTEEESGDVECGSKPYMSYECRNNLGPTYQPAPADVWSLGIVLINMLFHRNPWKDPTEGDPNFDAFLVDPVGFLQAKFTGIGREVATYIANHVLCIDVEDRVSARDLGKWVRSLPEMIGGRRALHALKMAKLETSNNALNGGGKSLLSSSNNNHHNDSGMFIKSPVDGPNKQSTFMSALSSTAPGSATSPVLTTSSKIPSPTVQNQGVTSPTLSDLPPATELSSSRRYSGSGVALMTMPELDRDDITSATTFDDQPTPADSSGGLTSPEPIAEYPNEERDEGVDRLMMSSPVAVEGDNDADVNGEAEADGRSLSMHRRRKRGIRKGKAAQAALAAAASGDSPSPTQEERDALLKELATASQDLARHLSKRKTDPFDPVTDFPPLGTTPAQAAAARKSRWKDFMAISKGNPQLEALARRVAEREAASGAAGNWSAPAKMQAGRAAGGGGMSGQKQMLMSMTASGKPAFKHTATASSGFSSQLSSFATVSSATSSTSGGAGAGEADGDENWRKNSPSMTTTTKTSTMDSSRGRAVESNQLSTTSPGPAPPTSSRKRMEGSSSRARQAAIAAAAITGGMEPMGAFGKRPTIGSSVGSSTTPFDKYGPLYRPRHTQQQQQQPQQGVPSSQSLVAEPSSSSTNSAKTLNDATPGIATFGSRPSKASTVNATTLVPNASLNHSVHTSIPRRATSPPQTLPLHSHQQRESHDDTSSSVISSSQFQAVQPQPEFQLQQQHPYYQSSLYQQQQQQMQQTPASPTQGMSPNKAKIKGQISSLAKMLGGLKTKGRD